MGLTFEQAQQQNTFWENLAQKQAAETVHDDLFVAVFEDHTAKLAALDPDYARALVEEQEKQAFLQGYEAVMQQHAGT